ncbi:MAG: VOC family protein, partial [Nitrospirota bacterium]
IYSFDPNGIPIEFSFSVKGVDIRKTPRMIDAVPSPVAREGPEPQPSQWPAVARPTSKEERRVYPGEGRDLVGGKRDTW